MRNGSTGGTDIVAACVNKYRDISLGRVLIFVDLGIILSSYTIFEDWRKIVFGLVLMVLENFTLDYFMTARMQSVQFLIFSKKSKEIAHDIATKMQRGITILDGHGWYSGNEMQVLCILAKKREQISMLRIIKRMLMEGATVDGQAVKRSRYMGFRSSRRQTAAAGQPSLFPE